MIKIINILLGKFDGFIVKLLGWTHIPYSKNNFMYLAPHKYKGKNITLKDGTSILKGDWVAELHIDNSSIKVLDTRYTSLIRLLRGELLALKQCFPSEPYAKIKAVYGISVFGDIAVRQGFTILDIDSSIKRFFTSIWENILRLFFKTNSTKTRKKFVISRECWISKDQILKMN